ncbi:MAG TPA: S8 family serine peptidase, partial [Pirellulales bacterium]
APDFAGNSFSKSRNLKSLSGERIISDAVGAGDPADYYKFSVAKTADFRLELAGLSADLEVSLFDSKKRLIASSNNPEAVGELIARQLAKGTYYVLVGRVGDAAGGYNLTLTAALDAAGDSRKSAAKLGALSTSTVTVGDRIGGIDGHDYYKFSVSSATNVNLSLAELTGDANLSLYNSKGRLVAGSSQSGTSSEELSLTLAKGTYYLDVTPGFGVVADYRLSVTTGPRSAQGSVPSNGSPAPTAPTAPTNPSSPTTPTSPSTGVTPLPNVPTYGGANDWHLNSINAPESWSAGYTGRGVIVAVLDTGIDYNHSEFAGRIWTNAGEIAGNGLDDDGNGFADDVHGWNFVEVNADPLDESGHGTHVAGLIAAARNNVGSTGVAYDATIMPIQVLAANGASYTDDIAAGVYYAVDNGAKIINMSLGAGADTYVLREAIAYAAQHGVLIVAASGNTSAATPDWPARYSSMFDNVISVGSYGAQNGHSSFSNVVGTSQSVQVDAPGESIYSTLRNNSYGTYTGTSMATPQVAGLAALMLSANPNLTAAQ